ncbi:RNA polymerase I associated factor, A49-like protein [Pseudovirgaria hyperparasitica]|uniref:RNA polymerase I associated factor, A49-like protein n=1 Tax=Pseudovirgaria hyperparasitica TaxID=470096 RepID=A0A6A6W1F5_9PEZI|nr:RNA polymerase I associated factor, A49-like protein [Pseudovirgaria hyperparasitica]KAF2755814.1 RNA polymerase I associated factor, A49-like protein [Pseudovirgaria hyperparasitica]
MTEKRKRQSTGLERPAKKSAIELQELGPILASTPCISLPREAQFQTYLKEGKLSRSKELLLYSSNHDELDYIMREEEDGHTKHYIGVYDPTTDKLLRVIEVPRRFSVRCSLRRETQESQREGDLQRQRAAQASNMNARNALGLEFGGAKAKKQIKSLTENAITSTEIDGVAPTADAATAALISSIVHSTADMPSQETVQAEIAASRPRPIANLATKNLQEVYTIESLIPASSLISLEINDWIEDPDNIEGSASRFVANRVMKIARSGDTTKVKALRYILHLLQFHNSLPRKRLPYKLPKREELKKLMKAPDSIISDIVRKFSTGNQMPRWNVDYLITHICALALIVDQFDVDIFALHKDLSREPKEICDYFREIGCKIANPTETERQQMRITKAEASDHRIAKLRIPLEFPTIKARGQAKKR